MEYQGSKLLIFHNTSTQEMSVDLSGCAGLENLSFATLSDSIGVSTAKLEGTVLTIGAQTSVILK